MQGRTTAISTDEDEVNTEVAPGADAEGHDVELPVTLLEPLDGRAPLGLGELWARRELVVFLAHRDVKLRYRQTFLGAAWALLQPLLTMAIFTVVFDRLADVDSDGAPYALFALAALVPWSFFANGLATTAMSLVGNASLVGKVYFPRLAVPFSAALAGIVDLSVGVGLLVPASLLAGRVAPARLLVLPLLVLLALAAVTGPGVVLAAVNVRYRDVRYVIPFFVQTLLFVSPVAYATTAVRSPLRDLYALNPMVGVIEGFRWSVVGTNPPILRLLVVSGASGVAMLVLGLRYFRSREGVFADVI